MKLIIWIFLLMPFSSFSAELFELNYSLNTSNKGVWVFENVYVQAGEEKRYLSGILAKNLCSILTTGQSEQEAIGLSHRKGVRKSYIAYFDDSGVITEMVEDYHTALDSFTCQLKDRFMNYMNKTEMFTGILFEGPYFIYKDKILPLSTYSASDVLILCKHMVGPRSQLLQVFYEFAPSAIFEYETVLAYDSMGELGFFYYENYQNIILQKFKCSYE